MMQNRKTNKWISSIIKIISKFYNISLQYKGKRVDIMKYAKTDIHCIFIFVDKITVSGGGQGIRRKIDAK